MALTVGMWALLVPGHWPRAIGILALFLTIVVVQGMFVQHYEQTGQAVPIPRRRLIVKFPRGLPLAMLATRLVFLITVAVMVVFGFAPMADSTAQTGIISCVFALIAAGVLNVAIERHYVGTGRALEIDVSRGSDA